MADPDYSQVREPLEVFAIDSKMNRATGSIPYRSLRWVRRYTRPGEFEMVVPADIYDPSWAYIDAWDRPELGIVQKVEFNDSSTVYGGIDSVTVSGFFLESVLNNIVFLAESPEEQKVYVPTPRRPTFSHKKQDTKIYQDPMGDYYYENSAGDIVSADDGRIVVADGLTEVDYNNAFGNMYGNPDLGYCSYDYYYNSDKTQITTVPYLGDDHGQPGKTYDIEFEDDKGNVFYKNDYGTLTQAIGVVDGYGDTYQVRKRRWNALEGDSYGRYYTVTVKGPWQRTDALEPVTEGDSVQIVLKWAQRMMGDWILYEEPTITGIQKKVDPSFQYLGDLLYSTLYEAGASLRLEYLFEKNICILSVYRGADRTQDQDGSIIVPDPILPAGYTQLDYIASSGTQYVDTGFVPNQDTKVECRAYPLSVEDTSDGHGSVFYGSGIFYDDSAFELYTSGGGYQFNYGSQNVHLGTPTVGPWFDIVQDKGTVSMSSGTVTWSHVFSYTTFNSGRSAYLFAINRGSALRGHCRIARFKIYDNGNLVRDYYPCKRDSDGAIGLYDLANSTFYGNSGTGAFIAGPESEIPSHEEPIQQNPWAVFSDTWGTITGYSCSRDESNYKNTCYVLYDYDKPDSFDESGWPVAGFINAMGDLLALPTLYGISYTSNRGYNTERVGDEDEPAIETYLDLRDEKPSCDSDWSRETVELPGESGDEREQAIAQAQQKFAPPEDAYNMQAVYEAYEEALNGRGKTHLEQNYYVVTNLDTGTVNARDYLKGFDLGDLVEFAVSTVGMQSTGRIIEVEEVYESGKADIRITVGDEQLTTIQKAKLSNK